MSRCNVASQPDRGLTKADFYAAVQIVFGTALLVLVAPA